MEHLEVIRRSHVPGQVAAMAVVSCEFDGKILYLDQARHRQAAALTRR
ncbi:MAG: hypothetical protein NT031_03675 [Planctomycetota bacterium]|nr:hypothetical protein [Planctomycetota bacterium]